MGDWSSYALEDFVPFTAEVYFRLIKHVGESFWPLHLVTVGAGLAAWVLAISGRVRIAVGLIAAALAWVGVTFLMRQYAQLNWAGTWFGWGFVVEAGLLFLIAVVMPRADIPSGDEPVPARAGGLLAGFGLLAYPLVAPLAGHEWFRSETFGIHPDPTAVVTLGIVLIVLRGARLWLAAIIPLSWILVSALTLQALNASWAVVLYAVVGVSISSLIWSSAIYHRRR